MSEICYIKKIINKPKFEYRDEIIYCLYDNKQNNIAKSFYKNEIEEYKKNYEEWFKLPRYNLFELGSGEYEILEKSIDWHVNWEYINNNYKYYKTLSEACKKINELNNLVELNKQRQIKKRINFI